MSEADASRNSLQPQHLSYSADMTDNWKPYLCIVNEKLAFILVNLGLRESVPITSKPWLLWVWVYFQSPRAVTPSVARECQGILCGRITTEGRREFYFYGETKNGFRRAVKEAL